MKFKFKELEKKDQKPKVYPPGTYEKEAKERALSQSVKPKKEFVIEKPKKKTNLLEKAESSDLLIIKGESRFISSLASIFGVEGYYNLTIEQLYLKLGLACIKRSGLVQTDTIKRLNGVKRIE